MYDEEDENEDDDDDDDEEEDDDSDESIYANNEGNSPSADSLYGSLKGNKRNLFLVILWLLRITKMYDSNDGTVAFILKMEIKHTDCLLQSAILYFRKR